MIFPLVHTSSGMPSRDTLTSECHEAHKQIPNAMSDTMINSGDIEPSANLIESTFPECEHLTGRKRQICRNEAGLPLDGPHSVNAYRQSWGLPPLDIIRTNEPARSSGILQRVASFAGVMLDTAKRGRLLSEPEIAERLAICQACEYFTGKGCSKCGCACNSERKLMNKIAHHAAECPLKKWTAK